MKTVLVSVMDLGTAVDMNPDDDTGTATDMGRTQEPRKDMEPATEMVLVSVLMTDMAMEVDT